MEHNGNDWFDYYARKIESIVNYPHNINSSLVAEVDGKIVGFIMGDIYFGEFGIPRQVPPSISSVLLPIARTMVWPMT